MRSDASGAVWVAPLAPTVVHARGSAPRRPVTRPFFHGLAPQQHTRLRALGLATPAVAVDAQQAKLRNAGALVQHRARVPDHAWMACRGGSWFSCRPRSAVLAKVRLNKQRARVRVGASEHGWMGGAMCIPRGRGRPYRTVAVSLAREDYTRAPRWRATARIVLFSRERPVSRFGQKNEKLTTCEPSMLWRSAWSRPTRGQRSACTSSPRRPRARHWKWAG